MVCICVYSWTASSLVTVPFVDGPDSRLCNLNGYSFFFVVRVVVVDGSSIIPARIHRTAMFIVHAFLQFAEPRKADKRNKYIRIRRRKITNRMVFNERWEFYPYVRRDWVCVCVCASCEFCECGRDKVSYRNASVKYVSSIMPHQSPSHNELPVFVLYACVRAWAVFVNGKNGKNGHVKFAFVELYSLRPFSVHLGSFARFYFSCEVSRGGNVVYSVWCSHNLCDLLLQLG